MANETRAFRLDLSIRLEQIVEALTNHLMSAKGMEVQSAPTTDGYVLQASQPSDGWKTISGTRLAITVYMARMNDVLNVTIGEGQWSDKIGAGAVGWFVAWPFAVTALVGAVRQKKLPEEIFGVIEKTILAGGRSVVITGAGSVIAPGMVVCPNCKTQNPAGSQFCNGCGTKIAAVCPGCGAVVAMGTNFCNACGTKLV